MKYLLILSLFTLVGCLEDGVPPDSPKLQGIPRYHMCHQYWDRGWHIDPQACYKHFLNPKFKIGKKLYINSSAYDKKCTFVPTALQWSPALDKPTYFGNISCPDAQFKEDAEQLEESLTFRK